MVFDWHDGKSEECLQERGFDFAFAARLFDDEMEEFLRCSRGLRRRASHRVGQIDGLMFAVVYTQRDDVRWIISAFRCRERELERWKRRAEDSR